MRKLIHLKDSLSTILSFQTWSSYSLFSRRVWLQLGAWWRHVPSDRECQLPAQELGLDLPVTSTDCGEQGLASLWMDAWWSHILPQGPDVSTCLMLTNITCMQVNNTWYTFFPNHESFRQAIMVSHTHHDDIIQDPEPRVAAARGCVGPGARDQGDRRHHQTGPVS